MILLEVHLSLIDEYEDLSGNAAIETTIHKLYARDDKNSFLFLLTMLCSRMKCKGHVLVPFATAGEEESRRKQCGNVIMSIPLYDMMEIAYKSEKVEGLVINSFGKYVRLTKELLGFI